MPYSPEAITTLRHAAASQIQAAEVMKSLGWDGDMLARVCRKHQIDLIGAIPATPKIEPRAPNVGVTNQLRAFAGMMSGRAGMMLLSLTRHPVGSVVQAKTMGLGGNNPTSAMAYANKHLRNAGLPWAVEGVKGGADSGYRLIRTDGEGWAP